MDNNINNTLNLDVSDIQKNDIHQGLSDAEVSSRKADGKVNVVTSEIERSTKEIVLKHTLTLFNALNLTLFILILIAGQPLNGTFVLVIFMNTASGIIQEVRAKKILERLTILNTFSVEAIRNGKPTLILPEEIVEDDVIYFKAGEQIIVDGIVLDGKADVNESLLTGESDAVAKEEESKVFSGSFVSAGDIYVQAIKVGDAMYVNQLAKEAKQFKMMQSPLQDAIDKIVKWIIIVMLPLGIVLMSAQLFIVDNTWQNAIVRSVAGIVGMIPEGLVLLTTVAFLAGITKLSRFNTLVQEMPAIEMLARVDVLCLDKTGTITEGRITVADLKIINNFDETYVIDALGALGSDIPLANATLEAISEKYTENKWQVQDVIPFSSSRKWSGATFEKNGTWILGATEFVQPEIYARDQKLLEEYAQKDYRVLSINYSPETIVDETLPENLELVGYITFTDIIRESAYDTLQFFKRQGVEIKIISGDNPMTVASVAQKAGVERADEYIDCRYLPEDMNELQELVQTVTVFGRVTPEQKQQIIKAIQANGHTVGMTGDGVNDVLALKQADCAIAMANGSEASRTVAQLVLLDSDFASLPKVVDEGRKIVNNIQQVASLYLIKSMYSIVLSVLAIVLMRPYPFQPIQLSLIGVLIVGLPTFFMALQPNTAKIKEDFFQVIMKDTIPGALTIIIMTIAVQVFADIIQATVEQRSTMAIMMLGGVQFLILVKVAFPASRYIVGMFIINIIVFICVFFIPFAQKILGFTYLPMHIYLTVLGGIIFAWFFFNFLQQCTIKYIDKKNKKTP